MTSQDQKTPLIFFVNGKKIIDDNVDPEWTLLYYLRTKLRLSGTKLGCGEGGCGACTVMISKYDRTKNKVIHLAVNACLAPICSVHGFAVTTIEGIGSTRTKLHPVQERIAKFHGSQCGFCTPGIVMSMYTLLRNNQKPTMEEMEVTFQGNLCRCTGYRPIIESYKTFTCGMGDQCCRVQKNSKLVEPSDFTSYDPTQEPIYPPELKLSDQFDQQFLVIKGKNVTWFRPRTLQELLELKSKHPEAKLVVGNTEVGIETKFKNLHYPILIHSGQIPKLLEVHNDEKGITIGASVSLLVLEEVLAEEIERHPKHKTRTFQAIMTMLNLFASKQIRSVGSIGGNIVTASPISDLLPILMATKTRLLIQSKNRGKREIILDKNFFKGYRQTILEPDEVLVAITIPLTDENHYCYFYKQSRRRDDDIAIVNFAISVQFTHQKVIEKINLNFGGMSYKTVEASKTQKKLEGLPWNRKTLDIALDWLLEDLPLDFDAPGGMVQYRHTLCLSLFFKAFLTISKDLELELDPRELSGFEDFGLKEYKSSQYFSEVSKTNRINGIHEPIVHLSAYKQATGEAAYCDDIPKFEDELHLAFVLSTKAHAWIKKIDPSEALAMEGVYDFISAKDIDVKNNKFGPILQDEQFFYDQKITSQGQIIGGVLAIDQNIARQAARKVRIEYEKIKPVIVTIEDAIKHNSFFDYNPIPGVVERVEENGNINEVFNEAPMVLEGECRTGAQEHFYLETQSVIVVPKKEDGELEVFSSTQNTTYVAKIISEALDISQNKILVRVKRLGGGFGGKDAKPVLIAAPAAIAAVKLNRPVRCSLDRDEDILMTGGRHPSWSWFKVAFDKTGKILGLDVKIYINVGYSLDASPSVLERAFRHLENAYNVPTIRIRGYLCKTNVPSNTAFRAFGTPQGMFIIETALQDIADYLQKDKAEVCEINLYKEGDITPYNQKLINCTIDKCWKECLKSSKYHQRVKEVQVFNQKHRFKKRGLSLICTKYGIAFTKLQMNQAGALVLVYTDGSILLHHGGVEMGQGLVTKMIQVASAVLEVPVNKIHTTEVSTDKIPNVSSTAASSGSDIYGMAIMEACTTIKNRLEPFKKANPNGIWEDWVKSAYMDRVSLFASGFYKTPNLGYNAATGENNLYNYYTYGVGCSEVEIDTLTGDHQVRRVDIVMDLGQSLNPAIDVGQIEGAFMQGYGLFIMEEMVCSPKGVIYSRGPGTYKLPGFGDIPKEFNVSLLKGVSNPRAVFSSKAVGEPPLFLGCSAFFAVKNAIKAAREENGASARFRLDSPATCERIRLACQDKITKKLKEAEPGSFVPWNVTL